MAFHLPGELNETKFNGLLRRRLEISTNPHEAIPTGALSGQSRLGFWLPHGNESRRICWALVVSLWENEARIPSGH